MNHTVKKFRFVLLVVILAVALEVTSSAAVTLNYWSSSQDAVSYFPYDGSYFVHQLSTNSTFKRFFNSGVAHATTQWNKVLPVGIGETSESYALSTIFGGTYSQLKSRFPSLTQSMGGLTIGEATPFETGRYNGASKTIGRMDYGFKMCVVENDASTSNSDACKNIALHEMGHLFGWFGHSPQRADVMYPTYDPNNIYLTERDKNHLKQIYDLFY